MKRLQGLRRRLLILVGCLAIALFALPGCGGTGTPVLPVTPSEDGSSQELSFTTLVQDSFGVVYEAEEPGLLVFSQLQDLEGLELNPPGGQAEDLRALDFAQYFALLVLEGQKNNLSYGEIVTVTQVLRRGEQVIVRARFPGPVSEHEPLSPMVNSPYHLVAVRKAGSWGDDFQFVLENEAGESVAQTTHFIP